MLKGALDLCVQGGGAALLLLLLLHFVKERLFSSPQQEFFQSLNTLLRGVSGS